MILNNDREDVTSTHCLLDVRFREHLQVLLDHLSGVFFRQFLQLDKAVNQLLLIGDVRQTGLFVRSVGLAHVFYSLL